MRRDDFDFQSCLERLRVDPADDAAARDLVVELHPMVMRICQAHRPGVMAADDIAQEILVKVLQRLGQYRASAPFPHWVARIAYLTCLEHRRHAWVRREIRWSDLSEEQQAVLATDRATLEPEAQNPPRDAAGLVQRLLATLTEPERLVVTMLDLEGKSVAEIRAVTGWGASRVKVTAWRARRKLGRTAQRLRLQEERL